MATAPTTARYFRGTDIVEDVPEPIRDAALAWLESREIHNRSVTAYRNLRDHANAVAVCPRLAWGEPTAESLRRDLDIAWDHSIECGRRSDAARRDLATAVEGPKAYYPVRGWLVGYTKKPREGKCGHQLDVKGPGEWEAKVRHNEGGRS